MRRDPNRDIKRQKSIIESSAMACLLVEKEAFVNHKLIAPYWKGEGYPATKKQILRLRPKGGYYKAIQHYFQNDFDDSQFAPWTGGFLYGLRLVKGLKPDNSVVATNAYRAWLNRDIVNMPFYKKLSGPSKNGRIQIRYCKAFMIPHKGDDDITVLAGIFAGAQVHVNYFDEEFYSLPATPEIKRVLDNFRVHIFRQNKNYGYYVSPFYAALMAQYMPPNCAQRVLHSRNPLMCPLLPLAYWEVMFGNEGVPMPPQKDILPFACADISRKRYHWGHRFLHKTAVDLGFASVPLPMRIAIENYRKNQESKRLVLTS